MGIVKSILGYCIFVLSHHLCYHRNRSAALRGGEHSPAPHTTRHTTPQQTEHKQHKQWVLRESMAWVLPTVEERETLRFHIRQGEALERRIGEYHPDPKLEQALKQPGTLYEEWLHFERRKPYVRLDNTLTGVFGICIPSAGLIVANPSLCASYGVPVKEALDHEHEHYWQTDPHLNRRAHEERVRDTRIRVNPTSVATEDYRPALPDTTIRDIEMAAATRAAYEGAFSSTYRN